MWSCFKALEICDKAFERMMVELQEDIEIDVRII